MLLLFSVKFVKFGKVWLTTKARRTLICGRREYLTSNTSILHGNMWSGEESEILTISSCGHWPARYIFILAAQQQFVLKIWQRSRLGCLLQPAEEQIDGLLQKADEQSWGRCRAAEKQNQWEWNQGEDQSSVATGSGGSLWSLERAWSEAMDPLHRLSPLIPPEIWHGGNFTGRSTQTSLNSCRLVDRLLDLHPWLESVSLAYMQVAALRLVARLIILASRYPLLATCYLSPSWYKQKIYQVPLCPHPLQAFTPSVFLDSRMQQSTNYMCMTYWLLYMFLESFFCVDRS